MNKQNTIRLIVDILLFMAVLNGWWFIALPIVIIGLWSLSFFIEALIAGIVFDSLFGSVPGMGIWGYVGTIAAAAVMIVVMVLKRMMR